MRIGVRRGCRGHRLRAAVHPGEAPTTPQHSVAYQPAFVKPVGTRCSLGHRSKIRYFSLKDPYFPVRNVKTLRTVNEAPTPRSRRLLPLWIIVDLHRRSPFSRCVVGTRSRLQRAADYQPLAIRERPRVDWPKGAHDLPE